jgi:SAM-dependent methyltransferase
MLNQLPSGVPADILVDLGIALCPRGPVATPRSVAEVVERCEDAGRRSELQELIHRVDGQAPSERAAIVQALDEVQVRSKLWLIDELTRLRDLADAELLVLGAWYGMLPLLFNLRLERPPRSMICVDIDPRPCAVGQEVIGSMYPNIRYHCADVMEYDYEGPGENAPTVVVNTICEHLPDVANWWRRLPRGRLVVLQSNNYFPCPDHVNCVRGLDEMREQTPLSEVLYEGVLPLSLFDRFMMIGYS